MTHKVTHSLEDSSKRHSIVRATLRIGDCSAAGIWLTTQGFSRRERESSFEDADLLTREAVGCKPVLASLVVQGPVSHGDEFLTLQPILVHFVPIGEFNNSFPELFIERIQINDPKLEYFAPVLVLNYRSSFRGLPG